MFDEVLTDKTQYPDETEVSLGNGKKTTVGEMRKQVGLTANFTKQTQKLADEKRNLEATYQQKLGEMTQAVMTAQSRGQVTLGGQNDGFEAFLNDPNFRPLAEPIKKLQEKMQAIDQIQARLQTHEQNFLADRYGQVLTKLKEKDPSLDTQDFATFAKNKQLYNLDDAYTLYTLPKTLEKAKTDAAAKAREDAKLEAMLPPVPHGVSVKAPADAPKSAAEAFDKLKSDPAFFHAYNGQDHAA